MKLTQAVIDFLIAHTGPVVIAVSGWPDSMCVATLIRDFWLEQWRSLNNSEFPKGLCPWGGIDLHVAHYHHGLRSQSDSERDIVMQYCPDMTVHVWYYDGDSSTERDLRVARHAFFQSVMEEVGSDVLITGHNLTDRIETSLMNMRRGCQIRGMMNMREVEDKKWLKVGQKVVESGTKSGWNILTILRPLLSYPKKQIQNYCDEHQIPYMIDESNLDPSVSQRNQIRHEIVMKLSDQELADWKQLYTKLEASQMQYDDPVRDEQMQWWYVGSVGEWTLEYLAWLFDWSRCYDDMTQGRLLEWQQWIARSFSGEKFVWWWRWWIKRKGVYMVKIW